MKKIILFAAAVLVIGSAQAQEQIKPTGGTFGLEVQFRPLGNNVIQTLGSNNVPIFGVSTRYFCTDRIELRGDFLFGFDSDKDKTTDASQGQATETEKNNTTSFGLNLGMNYHFKGTERISPYVGSVIGFGIGTQTQNIANLNYISGDSYRMKEGSIFVNFALVTGFNWYIVNGLYIGAEIGFGLGFEQPQKVKEKTVVGGTETSVTTKPTTSTFGLNFFANPAIRLGWKF